MLDDESMSQPTGPVTNSRSGNPRHTHAWGTSISMIHNETRSDILDFYHHVLCGNSDRLGVVVDRDFLSQMCGNIKDELGPVRAIVGNKRQAKVSHEIIVTDGHIGKENRAGINLIKPIAITGVDGLDRIL